MRGRQSADRDAPITLRNSAIATGASALRSGAVRERPPYIGGHHSGPERPATLFLVVPHLGMIADRHFPVHTLQHDVIPNQRVHEPGAAHG